MLEIRTRDEWFVHKNVAHSVDAYLRRESFAVLRTSPGRAEPVLAVPTEEGFAHTPLPEAEVPPLAVTRHDQDARYGLRGTRVGEAGHPGPSGGPARFVRVLRTRLAIWLTVLLCSSLFGDGVLGCSESAEAEGTVRDDSLRYQSSDGLLGGFAEEAEARSELPTACRGDGFPSVATGNPEAPLLLGFGMPPEGVKE